MTKLLNKYKNGNAIISIFDDGTRITEFPDNEKINLDFFEMEEIDRGSILN